MYGTAAEREAPEGQHPIERVVRRRNGEGARARSEDDREHRRGKTWGHVKAGAPSQAMCDRGRGIAFEKSPSAREIGRAVHTTPWPVQAAARVAAPATPTGVAAIVEASSAAVAIALETCAAG